MPLFGNKFSPKKTRQRKNLVSLNSEESLDELVLENKTVLLTLGDQQYKFEKGDWIPGKKSFNYLILYVFYNNVI